MLSALQISAAISSRVDHAAAHFLEMRPPLLIYFFQKFILIVDLSNRCDRKASEMRLDEQRLRLIIRNTSDPEISLQFLHIFLKF